MKERGKTTRVLLIGIVLFLMLPFPAQAATAAKPEGTLTVALPTLAEEGFLPDRSSQAAGPLWECVYDFLIYDNSKTAKPMPGLAEKWEYSKDFKTLTFHLRKGVQFHDGWGELTAEDVKWNIEFNARPASTNIITAWLNRSIKSMDVVDRYTLVLNLKKPDPMLWFCFTTGENVTPILSKKYVETVGEEKANQQPIGSGPYRLLEAKQGEYAKFEAYDKHWLVVPEFKYVILRVVPEETTRVAMLKTGEVDIATELDIDKLPELEQAKLGTVILKNSITIFLPFGGMLIPDDKRYVEGYHRMDPWKDIRVREAMNIAIDRKALVKTFFRGTATASPIMPSLPGWDKLKPIPYDPKRAKQLLSAAGYANGFSFKLMATAKQPMYRMLAEAVASYWEAIGLKTEIIAGDYATWRVTNKSGKTAGYVWINNIRNTTDWSGKLAGYELPNCSTPFWESEETKVAITKAEDELNLKKREGYWRELGQVYRSLYAHVPLVYAPRLHGVNKKVGEWPPSRHTYFKNIVFVKHAKPLNTYRLLTP